MASNALNHYIMLEGRWKDINGESQTYNLHTLNSSDHIYPSSHSSVDNLFSVKQLS
jgi:hypothetical protein